MRYFPLALAILLVTGCAYSNPLQDGRYQAALDRLDDNPLVQKTLNDHDTAVTQVEDKYHKVVKFAGNEGLRAALAGERQKMLDALKRDCVAALRRAEVATRPLNQAQADDIAWVADRIADSPWNERLAKARLRAETRP
jgi:hypothetical protein